MAAQSESRAAAFQGQGLVGLAGELFLSSGRDGPGRAAGHAPAAGSLREEKAVFMGGMVGPGRGLKGEVRHHTPHPHGLAPACDEPPAEAEGPQPGREAGMALGPVGGDLPVRAREL